MGLTTIHERAQDLISLKCKVLEVQLERAQEAKREAIENLKIRKIERIQDEIGDLSQEKEIYEYILKTLAEANK
jgi:hypothetical protein